MKKIICLLLILLLNGQIYAQQRRDIDDIDVSARPVLAFDVSIYGYIELKVSVTNKSPERTHRVNLYWPVGRSGGHHSIESMTREFEVQPGSTVEVSFWLPPITSYARNLRYTVAGQNEFISIDSNIKHGGNSYNWSRGAGNTTNFALSPNTVNVRVRQTSGGTQESFLAAANSATKVSASVPNPTPKRIEMPLKSWSNNWLAYTSAAGLAITAQEMRDCPALIAQGLMQYVNAGGVLLILGDQWQLPGEYVLNTSQSNNMEINEVGFGKCIIVKEPEQIIWDKAMWDKLAGYLRESSGPMSNMQTIDLANRYFPVVGDLTIPMGGLFTLVLLFALLVGPANLLFFAKRERRMRLLWSVPAVALAVSMLIFVYSVAAEGFEGHRRGFSFTLLNEKAAQAATLGWLGYYCPLTPADGLRFDTNTELTAQVASEGWRDGGGTARTIDWNKEQHLQRGWISARTPAQFRVRKSQKRLETIKINYNEQGQIVSLVNSMGGDIEKLNICDMQGRLYQLENLKSGQKYDVSPLPRKITEFPPGIYTAQQVYQRDWLLSGDDMAKNPFTYLKPGTYIAVMPDTPFVRKGLDKARESADSRHIVYGIMK